jgi:hypothetical protein
VTGPDKNGYYHDLFLRGRFDLSQRIGRLDTKAARPRPEGSPRDTPNFTVPRVPRDASTPVISPLPSSLPLGSLSVGTVAGALLNPRHESSIVTIAPLIRELLDRRSAVVGHNSTLFRTGRDTLVPQPPPLLARTSVFPLALPQSNRGMDTLPAAATTAHSTGRHRLWDHADLRALVTSSSSGPVRLQASSAAMRDGFPRGSMVTGAALLASLRPRGQVSSGDNMMCPIAAFLQSRLKTVP